MSLLVKFYGLLYVCRYTIITLHVGVSNNCCVYVALRQSICLCHFATFKMLYMSIRKIRLAVKQLLEYISQQFPNVHIIWSLILPRLSWRYSQNSNAMEKPENGLFLSLNLDCVRLEVPLFTTLTF